MSVLVDQSGEAVVMDGTWEGHGRVQRTVRSMSVTFRPVVSLRSLTDATGISAATAMAVKTVAHYDPAESTPQRPHLTEVGQVDSVSVSTSSATIQVGTGLAERIAAGQYQVVLPLDQPGLVVIDNSAIRPDRSLAATFSQASHTPSAPTLPISRKRLITRQIVLPVVADQPGQHGVVFGRDVLESFRQQLDLRDFHIAQKFIDQELAINTVGHTCSKAAWAGDQLLIDVELAVPASDQLDAGTAVLLPAFDLNQVDEQPAVGDTDIPTRLIKPTLLGLQFVTAEKAGPLHTPAPIVILHLPA